MAAGDDTLGGQDLAVTSGQARTFRFVRAGGFSGTWTAVAGSTLTYDLTVADDGADKLVTIPAANSNLIGKPWRFRRNGVDKVGGTITLLRPSDPAGDGTVTFTDADAVTITVSVVAGDNATEVAFTPSAALDPDTVGTAWASPLAGQGVSPDRITTYTGLGAGYIGTAAEDVAAGITDAGAVGLLALGRAGVAEDYTEALAAAVDVDGLPYAVIGSDDVNHSDGSYTGGTIALSGNTFEAIFLASAVDDEGLGTSGSPVDTEIITRMADGGTGAWDDVEAAIRWVDGKAALLGEHTASGGTSEADTLTRPIPTTTALRLRYYVHPTNGSSLWINDEAGGTTTARGYRWRKLAQSSVAPTTIKAAGGADQRWHVGLGPGKVRLYRLQCWDGSGQIIDFDPAGVSAGTIPEPLQSWDWVPVDYATVVTPSAGSGPDLSDATPAALGTAAAGTSPDASRADHVHPHAFGSLVVPLWVPSSTNGTWGPSSAFDYIFNGSAVDGHWIEWLNVPLGGTYTIGCAVQATNGSPKFQVSVDGSNVGSLLDAYASSTTATVLTSTGVAITPGLHTVRVTVNGKHASSSGYLLRLASVAFTRTT